jgi:hypothetical protein
VRAERILIALAVVNLTVLILEFIFVTVAGIGR